MENNYWDAEDKISTIKSAIEGKSVVSSFGNTIAPQDSVPTTNSSACSASSGLHTKYTAHEIAFSGPLQFQQALQSLQKYPRSFVEAWLLLAKSLGMSVQSVLRNHRSDASLSIDEVSAIAMLKDLPHDQILTWYGVDATNGPVAEGAKRCFYDDFSTCRSSTCSSIGTRRSSTRPSSYASFASLDSTSDNPEKEKRTSRRPRPTIMGDLLEAPETEASKSQEVEQPCVYRCTGCPKSFKSMQAWSRHEKEDHEDIHFPCMPNGPIEITLHGRECALCGQQPTKEHLKGHHIERCTQLKPVFKRSYELKQHLETHGLAKKSRQTDVLVSKWQRVPDKKAWACGFCKGLFSSLVEFHKHIASQHYERGENREWDHTKVILGLLSQSCIAGSWQLLLASRFKVHSLSCKWKKSKTGRLQTRLQLGQETGDALAQAALDCAIYDHSSLREAFRHNGSSIADSDRNLLSDTSGPPVPPKPQSLQPPPPVHSDPRSHTTDDGRNTEALSSAQFKTPSPQLFETSLSMAEDYGDHLDLSGQGCSNNFTGEASMDLVNPIDIDMDRHMGFSPQMCLPWDTTQNLYYSGDSMGSHG